MTAYPTNRMQADVIIVGGGFMGVATAFFLRRQGLSVILLERDLVGQAASGVNFGNVRRQSRYLGQLPLANRSRDIWINLPRLIGEDAEFVMSGHILVTTSEKDGARLEKYAVDCKPYGLDLTIMTGDQARAKFPMVGPVTQVRQQLLSTVLTADEGKQLRGVVNESGPAGTVHERGVTQ